jgi:hypothetical protein
MGSIESLTWDVRNGGMTSTVVLLKQRLNLPVEREHRDECSTGYTVSPNG